jgi:hypothetical protein
MEAISPLFACFEWQHALWSVVVPAAIFSQHAHLAALSAGAAGWLAVWPHAVRANAKRSANNFVFIDVLPSLWNALVLNSMRALSRFVMEFGQ